MSSAPVLCPIYAITDPALMPGPQLYAGVEAALAGGITTVQYRNKTASHAQKYDEAAQLVALCDNFGADLIINDDTELARATNASGVHLGQSDGSVTHAREQLGPRAIIGVTCHSDPALARAARADGASYVAFGRFYPSSTKPGAVPARLSVLEEARSLALPIVAIGGIDQTRLSEVKQHGATTAAVCHCLFASRDIRATAKLLLDTWNHYV